MWVPVALFEALVSSLTSPISKHQVKTVHPMVVLFLNQVFLLAIMTVVIVFLGGFPHVTSKFFFFMLCSSLLDCIAFICSYWAIHHTQISLLSPLNSFTPVFATIFGLLFLHEVPTVLKLIGILTIVCGVYLLNVSEIKGGLFKPLQKLVSDRGVRLYSVQVILFGITPIFQKQAIFETTPTMPIVASYAGNFFIMLYISLYALRKIKQEYTKDRKSIGKNLKYFFLFGLLNTAGQLAAYTVFSLTHVGYATAIFSLSSLFTIIWGGLFFKDNNIKERLIGAAVMISGTILLAM